MFSISDSIADDSLEEDFENTSSFLVDETGDTLDTATTSETTDGGFSDSLCNANQQLFETTTTTTSSPEPAIYVLERINGRDVGDQLW